MYLTIYKTNKPNITNNDYNSIMQETIEPVILEYYKITIDIPKPTPIEKLSQKQQEHIYHCINALFEAWQLLAPFKDNHEQQYYEFKIPKRSGGLRTINAPLPEFKEALSKVKNIFENKIQCLAHPAAYAYTKQKSVYDALKEHQKNKSNWYLKIDLTDFFPSCTPELIYNQLMQLYPFYYFNNLPKNILKQIIEVCCLNGGLPQGTPMSPLLTNLLMVPIDYQINNFLKRGTGNHFVYTRYADDILISSKTSFYWELLITDLRKMLQPFKIKDKKTRYGSKAGSNWNLGLMLNKDNNITLGYQKKKLINAMINNFLNDFKHNIKWSKEDVYSLQGQLSYLKHIEPEYYNHIKHKYETKYETNLNNTIKQILNPNI